MDTTTIKHHRIAETVLKEHGFQVDGHGDSFAAIHHEDLSTDPKVYRTFDTVAELSAYAKGIYDAARLHGTQDTPKAIGLLKESK